VFALKANAPHWESVKCAGREGGVQVGSSLPQSARSRELEAHLRATIARQGPIPFARFMEEALYHPELGYYSAGPLPWGGDADYITAPQVHPALGQSIATLAIELDHALGRPEPFALLEVGSGNGELARAVLEAVERLAPGLWERLRFTSVERGAAARSVQADLPSPGAGLRVQPELPPPGARGRGLVYANELFDAFPVHRVKQTSQGLLEAHVDVLEGRLVERYLEPSTEALSQHIDANSIRLADSQVAEVCLQVEPWLAQANALLEAGGLLAVDYGHPTATLYGPARRSGTLVAQQRFALFDDVLVSPGDRDLTAHVDFGNLQRVGERLSLHYEPLCSLRVFLIGMGATADQEGAPLEARMALRHLLVSEIADSHSVAFLHKGLAENVPMFGRARLDALV